MFCADTSSWVAYLSGEPGNDVEMMDISLRDRLIWMSPAVGLPEAGLETPAPKGIRLLPVVCAVWRSAELAS